MIEMQMGPMIDIVFLLLVFFMVTAKPIKPEADVGLQLPGTVSQDEAINLPNEVKIWIGKDATVIVNETPIASADDREMPGLLKLLTRFKQSSDANNLDALVMINAEDGGRHQRVVDVMDACARAGLHGVTFSPSDAE